MSRVPILTDIVPQGKSPPLVPLLPRISAVEVTNETPFPTSKELVFKEFDEEHGSGFAEDEAHKHVYLISRHTKGFHGQLKRDEHFLALVVYPNFVEQILEK